MITAAQLRAARGLVDWTRNELAEFAKISPETVKNIEHGIFRPQEQTAEAIIRTFAAHNVEFIENDGVRMRKDAVTRYEGVEGFKQFMEDFYEEAKNSSLNPNEEKTICAASIDDRNFSKYLGEYFVMHVRRMNELKNIKMRILHKERPTTLQPEEKVKSYREYRLRPEKDCANVPFYVYGDKFAILMFEEKEPPQIVVIKSALVAKAYREQFDAIWRTSKPLER